MRYAENEYQLVDMQKLTKQQEIVGSQNEEGTAEERCG